MRKINPFIVLFIFTLLFLPGCDLIAGIFKAGFWTAIILVVLVVAIIGWGIYRFTSGNDDT